jgi:GPH family glycoside/pentoside/hexuronide:cation symporter
MKTTLNDQVPAAIRYAYAAPAFSLAVVGIPVYVFLPKFYTDVVGVHIGLIGTLILTVRVFDALTDPAIGLISDRTRTRFGRRRPFIAIGSIVLALSLLMLFNPPPGSPTFETTWFGLWIFALFLFWTAVVVPYESLGPEITFDYHERTTLFGLRDGALILGTLAAASSPALVTWAFSLPEGPDGERRQFFWISVLYAPLVVAFCWWCVFAVREKHLHSTQGRTGLARGLRDVAGNRPFIILLISYTVSAFGNNLPATLILFYVQYVLQSGHANLFLLIYFVTGVGFLPGWILLSRYVGKKTTWIVSMVVNTGAFLGVFFLGPGDTWIYGILVFISGIGFGATVAIPSAMQADVIDYDELITGERREGHYIGLWSIAKKLAAALGVGAALSILGASGYQPNIAQSGSVVFTLRVLYALVPSLCNLAAIAIALAYPIDRERHLAIRAAIEERRDGKAVSDPLTQGKILEIRPEPAEKNTGWY